MEADCSGAAGQPILPPFVKASGQIHRTEREQIRLAPVQTVARPTQWLQTPGRPGMTSPPDAIAQARAEDVLRSKADGIAGDLEACKRVTAAVLRDEPHRPDLPADTPSSRTQT